MTKSNDEIAEAYRSPPWWYDLRGFFILTFAYNSTLSQQIRLFGPNYGARHLELACGTGTLLSLILRWRQFKKLPLVDIVGVDYAESMLEGARRRFARTPGMRFLHGDAAAMPFPDATFDTANIANSVHCFPDVDAALSETFRVLKPGGRLALNVLLFPHGRWPLAAIAQRINTWGIRKGILVTPYELRDIKRRIVSSGFNLVSESTSGNCYNVLAKK